MNLGSQILEGGYGFWRKQLQALFHKSYVTYICMQTERYITSYFAPIFVIYFILL